MKQPNFADWNGFLEGKYRLTKKDTGRNVFRLRPVQWMNFGWGEQRNPSTSKFYLVHHPDMVWFKKNFSRSEQWQRVGW